MAASKGWFTEEFNKIGAKVEIVDITNIRVAGAEGALLERGSIHFASRMSYPAYMHKLNGLDAVVIRANQSVDTTAVSLFVLADSPFKTVHDLQGKTVGTVRYHCGFAGALEIFDQAGLPLKTDLNKDGKVIWWNSPGYYQLQQGLLSGKFDAVVDHASIALYAAPILQNQFRIIKNLPQSGTYQQWGGRGFHFAMRKWAEKNPDAVKVYIITQERSRKWISTHIEEAIPIIAKATRTPATIVRFQLTSQYQLNLIAPDPDWNNAVSALVHFQEDYKKLKDPLVSRKQLTKQEIEQYVDRRFFNGGEYNPYQ